MVSPWGELHRAKSVALLWKRSQGSYKASALGLDKPLQLSLLFNTAPWGGGEMPSPTIPMGSKQYYLNTPKLRARNTQPESTETSRPSLRHSPTTGCVSEGQANLLALQALDVIVINQGCQGGNGHRMFKWERSECIFFPWGRVQCSIGKPRAGWVKDEPEITICQLPPTRVAWSTWLTRVPPPLLFRQCWGLNPRSLMCWATSTAVK